MTDELFIGLEKYITRLKKQSRDGKEIQSGKVMDRFAFYLTKYALEKEFTSIGNIEPFTNVAFYNHVDKDSKCQTRFDNFGLVFSHGSEKYQLAFTHGFKDNKSAVVFEDDMPHLPWRQSTQLPHVEVEAEFEKLIVHIISTYSRSKDEIGISQLEQAVHSAAEAND